MFSLWNQRFHWVIWIIYWPYDNPALSFVILTEFDFAIDLIVEKVKWLRSMSPLYEMVQEGIDLKSIQWTAH